jgi:hypothetical protein
LLVSHGKKFIYLKTVKTAGTSLEIALQKYCVPKGAGEIEEFCDEIITPAGIIGFRGTKKPQGLTYFNHMSAEQAAAAVGPTVWDEYFKFCIVRNPYEVMVSYFCYVVIYGARSRLDEQKFEQFMAYLEAQDFSQFKGMFDAWLLADPELVDNSDKYVVDGRVVMDDIIYYEKMAEGIQRVAKRLDVSPDPLKKYKSGFRKFDQHWSEYYEEATAALVYKAVAPEFDLVGYNPESWRDGRNFI